MSGVPVEPYDDVHREFYGPNSTEYNNTAYGGDIEQDGSFSLPAQAMALIWFAMILFCYLAKPNIPDETHRRGLRRRRRAAARLAQEERKRDPEKRARLIEAALITKRVIARDNDLNLTLGEPPADEDDVDLPDDLIDESLEEDDDAAACVICLDVFQVGDDVTWSKNNQECLHVFHQECIIPWLENPKHDDCPSCRCRIIPSEERTEEEDIDEEENLTMAFAIMNGLISRVRRASRRYSLRGNSSSDLAHQLDDLDQEFPVPPPMALRRVFSDGVPPLRRSNLPHRRDSLLSVAYKRASGICSQLAQSSTALDTQEPMPVAFHDPLPDGYQSGSTPLPPLRMRRVRSVDPVLGGIGGSDYVIDRNNDNYPPPEPVPVTRVTSMDLKRSISLKRVRSVDANREFPMRSSDFMNGHKQRWLSGRGDRRCSSNAVSLSIPLQRSSSAQSSALRKTCSDNFETPVLLRRSISARGGSLKRSSPESYCRAFPLQQSSTGQGDALMMPPFPQSSSAYGSNIMRRSTSGNQVPLQRSFRNLSMETAPGRPTGENLPSSIPLRRSSGSGRPSIGMRRVSSTGSRTARRGSETGGGAPKGGIFAIAQRRDSTAYSHLQQCDDSTCTDEEPDLEQGLSR